MRFAILILWAVLALASPGYADEAGYGPTIPRATGTPHPEGNDYMRRWHMTMMRHDRDVTMYEGQRPVNASLGQCFDCHTVRDAAGMPVTVADERHFCRACHDYAAVQVDCFDCHRSTPEDFDEPALHAFNLGPMDRRIAPDGTQIAAYLDTVTDPTTEAQE